MASNLFIFKGTYEINFKDLYKCELSMVTIVLNVAFCLGNISTTILLVAWNSEIMLAKMISVLVRNNYVYHQIYFILGFLCNFKVYKYFPCFLRH